MTIRRRDYKGAASPPDTGDKSFVGVAIASPNGERYAFATTCGQLFGIANPSALLNLNQANGVRALLVKWGKNPA